MCGRVRMCSETKLRKFELIDVSVWNYNSMLFITVLYSILFFFRISFATVRASIHSTISILFCLIVVLWYSLFCRRSITWICEDLAISSRHNHNSVWSVTIYNEMTSFFRFIPVGMFHGQHQSNRSQIFRYFNFYIIINFCSNEGVIVIYFGSNFNVYMNCNLSISCK
jgi:hypothetical protein